MQTKVKFRDQLKEYVRTEFKAELGQLHPVAQSKLMTRFYVREIQRVITPALVPSDEDDFGTCVIDGSNDCGVDFLSRAEGMVLIIQAKCRGYGIPEKLAEFIHFCEVLKRLHPVTGVNYPKNQKLLEAIGDIDWENDIFELQYISVGRAEVSIRTRAEEGPTLDDSALASLKDRCELTISDESDLNVKLREALSAGEMIGQPVKVHVPLG